jgi:hypothetical protein
VTRLRLYVHALRAARPRQLRARATRPLRRRRFPRSGGSAPFQPIREAEPLWRSRAFGTADAVAGDGALRLLGASIPFPPRDWTLPGEPRLRRFHLQYGEDVLAWARRGDLPAAHAALHAWLDGNPPGPGDAWHPYPLSTRVGNWIAALTLAPELAEARVVESLSFQLAYLDRNVEDDVLGNHVIRNAKALVLGGVALDDASLLRRGLALLEREVPEQVLPDGGHYERSPVYHQIVLRDLLEARAAAGLGWLDGPLERMTRFAAALTRPDGAPALFNDGTLDLAPELDLPPAPEGLAVFEDTGYAVVRNGPLWLAFDCGVPGPPYLPPHAHADALSFQLWFDGLPVIVDPGTSTYEPGRERDHDRSTRAHSTVTVAGRDQFELWGAFRAGPFPEVRLLGADPLEAEVVTSWYRHRRRLVTDGASLRVEDEVEPSGRAVSTLLLAPGAEPPSGVGGEPEDAWVAERFFERRATSALRAPAKDGWRLGLRSPP